MSLISVQPTLEFVRRQPVGFVRLVEEAGNFPVVIQIVRVTQLEGISNEFGLLLFVQQRHRPFDLLKTHKPILTHPPFYASEGFPSEI